MSPAPRPGDAGWQPEAGLLRQAERGQPGQLVRVLSFIPFVLVGAFSVIAGVSWLLVLVLGIGLERGSVLSWAEGRPASEVLPQVGLLLLIGAACVAFIVLSTWAAMVSLRATQPTRFWPMAEAAWALAGIALLYAVMAAPERLADVGLSMRDWYFALAVVAFSLVTTMARHRSSRRGMREGRGGRHA